VRLSIGPNLYFWERETVLDFYQAAADSPADIIYLGEAICSKRRLIKPEDWIAIGRELREAGKEVLFSTLTLIEAASEASAVKRLCENEEFMVEANDFSAIHYLSSAGRQFATGPSVNIYNHRTLSLLSGLGLKRWTLPVELGLDSLAELQEQRPEGVETEVFALGRLPLAYSARCYTARSENLPKDDCRFKCIEYPGGRMLKTREDENFLVLNGIQTQSALTHHALGQVPELGALGTDILRISPQSEHTMDIIDIFDSARNGADPATLLDGLLALLPAGACNGYLLDQPGMDYDDSKVA
jgi:collagenase-like PrtC family protease